MVNKINGSINDFSHLKIDQTPHDHIAALFCAVEQANLPEVKRLLSSGMNPNIQNTSGTWLLEKALVHFTASKDPLPAITAKAYSIIQYLIASGASCTQPLGTEYWNIFDYAFSTVQFGLLVALCAYYHEQIPISKRALENFLLNKKNTEFIYKYYLCIAPQIANFAMLHRDISSRWWDERFESLLQLFQPPYGHHPYLLITSEKMAQKFLDGGVNINVQDEKGFTALHYLARGVGDIGCLPLLLQTGADLFLPAKDGSTPLTLALTFALKHNQSRFLKWLQDSDASRNVPRPSLHKAILAEDPSKIEEELNSCDLESYDLETRDIFGDTAFQMAIRLHLFPAVVALSARCATRCTKTEDLFFAARYSCAEIFSFLIKQAEVDEEMIDELFSAARNINNVPVIKWMVEHYVLQYPALFGNSLIYSESECRIVSLSLFETCVQKIAESQDLHTTIGKLLIKSLLYGWHQEASLLLEAAKDRSFFKTNQLEWFYNALFKYVNEEFVEKAIKKFGLPEKPVDCDSLVSFYKQCPRLFRQFSHELYELWFVVHCKEKDLFVSNSLTTIALYIGEANLVERLLKKLPVFESRTIYSVYYITPVDDMLILSLQLENENITKVLVQAYKEQKKSINYRNIYLSIIENTSQKERKEILARTIKLQRTNPQKCDDQKCEEIADMLIAMQEIAMKEFSYAGEILLHALSKASSFSEVKSMYDRLYTFVQKISPLSLLPCGQLSSKETAEWLARKIFSDIIHKNPQLLYDETVWDTMYDLLPRMRSPEEYGALLEGLQKLPSSLLNPLYTPAVLQPRIVEVPDEQGKTELFRAAEQGNFSEVKRLLSFGANPNSKDARGISVLEAALQPLIHSTQAPHTQTSKVYSLIQLLVAYGADRTQPIGKIYWNIFDCAFSLQNYGLLFALHKYYTPEILVNWQGLESFYAIGSAEDLEFIMKYYPKLDLGCTRSATMCHAFIDHSRLDLLIKYKELAPHKFTRCVQLKGAFHTVLSPSLLVTALQQGKSKIASFLRENGATFTCDPDLLVITPKITKSFLEEGMNPNTQDIFGYTALHRLAHDVYNHLQCLPVLLQQGANPLLPANCGFTPIDLAIMAKNFRFLAIVGRGFTPLQKAIFHKSIPEIKQLSDSISPASLVFAAEFSSIEVLSFLISNITVDDNIMREMLDASKHNNKQVAQWLVEHYAIKYPKVLGGYLISDTSDTRSIAIILEYVQEMKKSQETYQFIGDLFLNAMIEKKVEIVSILLGHLDDRCFVGADYTVRFYQLLFENFDTETIEKVLKNFGITDEFFNHANLIEAFSKKCPHLFNQLSPELFERGWLLCQQKSVCTYDGVMAFAIFTGNKSFLGRCCSTFGYNENRFRSFLTIAIKAGCQEAVFSFANKIPMLSDPQKPLPDAELVLSLELGNDAVIQILMQVYNKRQIRPNFQSIYKHLFQKESLQESLKNMLIRTTKLLKNSLTESELEESASLLMQIKNFPAAVTAFALSISRDSTFAQSKKTFSAIVKFVHRLPSLCKVPCGPLSWLMTCDWLIEQTFLQSRHFNPKLFSDETVFDTILDLIPLVSKNEEYGALFVALQVAPDIETASLAFQRAKRLEEESKESFIQKNESEQKQWLAYACVYRDRALLPLCYYLIKNHEAHPNILFDALRAIHHIGVSRYNSELENTLATELERVLRKSQNEKVKIEALKAYVSITQISLDFLLAELTEARLLQASLYEAAVCRHLGKDYECTSPEECEKAVLQLLTGLQSVHEEVRFQTALALTSIPHKQGLLAALEVVQGPTWDRMQPHFGKNKTNITGSFLTFVSRPESLHDNRSAVSERIFLQLASLQDENIQDETIQALVEQDLSSLPNSTRYVSMPIAYPPQADLIRGISTRKGGAKFREAVRDLFRKGAGSSQLTDYDTSALSGTWNKIGHMFASHNKDLFFKNSPYFSTDAKGVVSESALIIFPAGYYQKEYSRGEARLEKEGTLNNVLYRGIPHCAIKAVYLPIRFKADIELLIQDIPVEEYEKGFTSDLFKGDTVKELKAFRRLLLAHEFVKKIRYFPEVGLQEIEKILHTDGIHFVTEEEVKKETAKLAVKMRRLKAALNIND